MDGFEVKQVMEQVHISEKMQEEIIMNMQKQIKNGKKRTWNWKKTAAAAAAVVFTAGAVNFPAQALVKSVVKARMAGIPKEEVQDVRDMIQEQETEADGFSRGYSGNEKERMKELEQSYENGTFPEKTIPQVDNADAAAEGTLCYIRSTGDFYLPEREITDEEILEIIDFQHEMSYAAAQSQTAKEARAEYLAEKALLEEKVQAAGGISEEEAIAAAKKQMESEIGKRADGRELMTDIFGCGAHLEDISDQTDYEHKGDAAYNVGFGNPEDGSVYTCLIDAVDGSVLQAWDN